MTLTLDRRALLAALASTTALTTVGGWIKPARAQFIIRDDGQGFDTSKIPAPGSASAMTPDVGRGLVLIHTFMDQVQFNDRGNEVTMIKNFG